MLAKDVTDTLNIAQTASGCGSAKVLRKPRPPSYYCSSYIAEDLAKSLSDKA
jgi:hypothetical protein